MRTLLSTLASKQELSGCHCGPGGSGEYPIRFQILGTAKQRSDVFQAVGEIVSDSFGSVQVECGDEVKTSVSVLTSADTRDAQGRGQREAWAAAEEYAKRHKITKDEARKVLANLKRKMLAGILKETDPLKIPPSKAG